MFVVLRLCEVSLHGETDHLMLSACMQFCFRWLYASTGEHGCLLLVLAWEAQSLPIAGNVKTATNTDVHQLMRTAI